MKVKENHFFAGQVGTVTQLTSPNKVIVALENGQRDLILLDDLELHTSLTKPLTEDDSKPKQIIIKEGLNYQAGEGLKWYIECEEQDYQLFKQLQRQNNAPSIRSSLVRIVQEKQEQQLSPSSDDLLVNLSSKINQLNQEQKLFLAQKLMESDPEMASQLRKLLPEEENGGRSR